jgi:hypothetical protein
MGTMIKRNRTTFNRCPKDAEFPFTRIPAKVFALDGYKLAIMGYILSNRDDWNIVKSEIANRTKFPRNKFNVAWKSLENLGYIKKRRIQGGWDYTINEDLGFTSTTDSKCESSTLTTGRQCTGGTLTTTTNNYYKKGTTGTVANCYESQFNELKELYPPSVIRKDGNPYPLKGKIKDCEKLYIKYLKTGKRSHDEIINCLKVELEDKMHTGNTMYQVGLLRWIEDELWEVYKGRTIEPAEVGYGTEIV